MNKLPKLVIWREWHKFKPTPLSKQQSEAFPNQPVTLISAIEADEYCKAHEGRLPTFGELNGEAPNMTFWEWTSDKEDEKRVCRGGSWYYNAWDVRLSVRLRNVPVYRGVNLGFRCIQST